MKSIFLKNEEDTQILGKKLGKKLSKGMIVCLNGDLGAGKTTITKSIAKSMRIDEDITSPTFTIVNEYTDNEVPLYHFDVYRIGSSEEMYDIGFEEYINSEGICIIEWSNLIEDILPSERLDIVLSYDGEGRKADLYPYGDKYIEIAEGVEL